MNPYFGDLHNHCGISYGHGPLEDALANAREQLDFVSVTGHAHWPDMPEPDERIGYIIDFHRKGFARIKALWPEMMATLIKTNREGKFVIFPGFEIHSCADGDRTVIFKDFKGDIIYADSIPDLYRKLPPDALSFPHHIGYELGARGINWATHDSKIEPLVELISMHGCSEGSENPRPFLHSMGPSDWENTVQYGLNRGHIFGFLGNTDHHSGFPGSYGHGATGVWAEALTREKIWEALLARRTWAVTGDRIIPHFFANGRPLGSVLPASEMERHFTCRVEAGGAIDCVDIIKNGNLFRRFSELDQVPAAPSDEVETLITLELGWGEKHKSSHWEVELELTSGEITRIEPRFRGLEVVSPVEKKYGAEHGYHTCHWEKTGDRKVRLEVESYGNPTNSTPTTQNFCLHVKMPPDAVIRARLNHVRETIPLARLLEGVYTGHLGLIDSPAYRFNRAPFKHEYDWSFDFTDRDSAPACYYLRVRQKNDQWAWCSPVWFR